MQNRLTSLAFVAALILSIFALAMLYHPAQASAEKSGNNGNGDHGTGNHGTVGDKLVTIVEIALAIIPTTAGWRGSEGEGQR